MMLGDGPNEIRESDIPVGGIVRQSKSAWRYVRPDGILAFWTVFPTIALPANASPIDKVAAQLRASAPGAEWNAAGIDRAREFAQLLNAREGIADLTKLTLLRVVIARDVTTTRVVRRERRDVGSGDAATTIEVPVTETKTTIEESRGFAVSDDGRRPFGFLGAQDTVDRRPVFEDSGGGLTVAWSSAGKGGVRLQVVPTEFGFAFGVQWFSTSDADRIRNFARQAATMAALTVLPAAGINLAATIGQTMLGSLATTYPALSSAMGRVVLSTAISGADPREAIKTAALSLAVGPAAGTIGTVVRDASGLDLLGRLAQNASAAALQGGDVRNAVVSTLIHNGFASMDEVYARFRSQIGFTWDDTPSGTTTPPGSSAPTAETSAVVTPPAAPAGSWFSNIDWNSVQRTVTGITNVATTVARGVRAVRDANNPPVVNVTQATAPDGTVATAQDDGTITIQGPQGISRQIPPVGVPHATPSGNLIVNNGNGTYTRITPTGQRSTFPYPANAGYSSGQSPLMTAGGFGTAGGFDTTTLALIGGVGVLALLLLTRGKR